MAEQELPTVEDVVIERLPFDFQQHDWKQEGYSLICDSCPQFSRHGTAIPVGKMINGQRGEWHLVSEVR